MRIKVSRILTYQRGISGENNGGEILAGPGIFIVWLAVARKYRRNHPLGEIYLAEKIRLLFLSVFLPLWFLVSSIPLALSSAIAATRGTFSADFDGLSLPCSSFRRAATGFQRDNGSPYSSSIRVKCRTNSSQDLLRKRSIPV